MKGLIVHAPVADGVANLVAAVDVVGVTVDDGAADATDEGDGSGGVYCNDWCEAVDAAVVAAVAVIVAMLDFAAVVRVDGSDAVDRTCVQALEATDDAVVFARIVMGG